MKIVHPEMQSWLRPWIYVRMNLRGILLEVLTTSLDSK